MKIEIKKYNNKSRKGRYVYIKEKGKRARILKYTSGVPIKIYEEAYNKQLNWREIKQLNQEYKTIKKGIKISGTLQEGVSMSTVSLQELGSITSRRRLMEKMLKPLVSRKEFIPILVKNASKFKNLFVYNIIINGIKQDGTKGNLGELTDIGNRNIEKLVYDLRKAGIVQNRNLSSNQLNEVKQKFKFNKSRQDESYGKIKDIKVQVILRR